MDADWSHDPAALPGLLAPLTEGTADLVIGSRYTDGGGVLDWGIGRRIISRGGSLFARTVLSLGPHDLTGGFKAWRAATLAAIPFDGVHAGGYVFQIEMTHRASRAGARVIAVSRRPFALEVARSQGAAITLPLADHDRIVGEVERLTGGAGADRVIEAVGLQQPLDLAGRLTRVRGRLVIAGYHQDGTRQVDMQLWNWRGIDVINAHERDPEIVLDGIRGAVAAVADGTLDPAPLYTHRFELDRLGEALETMRRRPDGFLKALVLA